MTPRDLIKEEIAEAFAPVRRWERLAPAERDGHLLACVNDTLPTLAWWGWSISCSRPTGTWEITARRTIGRRIVRGKGSGPNYITALLDLGERLDRSLAGSGR